MYFSIQASAYQLPAIEPSDSFTNALLQRLVNEGQAWQQTQFLNYDPQGVLGKSRHLSSATKLLCSTAAQLMDHPNHKVDPTNATRVGVYVAADTINLEDDFEFDMCARNFGPDFVSPLKAPNTLSNVVGSHLARLYDIQGPNCTIAAGQQSFLQSLDIAQLALQTGTIERALLGVVEVTSIYQQACGQSRELALLLDVVPYTNDAVRFAEPLLGRLPSWNIEWLASAIRDWLRKQSKTSVDLVLLAGEPLNPAWLDNLATQFAGTGISSSILCGEALFGHGESASAACGVLLAKEVLQGEVPSTLFEQGFLGDKPANVNSILVLSLDQQCGYSALLLERV